MLKLKLQYFGHLTLRVDSLEKPDAGRNWGQEEKGTTEDEMAGWHHQLDEHEFAQALGVDDGQGSLACFSPWGRKELDTTERLHFRFLQGASSAVLLHLRGHRVPGSSSTQRCPGAQPLPCSALQPAAPQTPPPRLHPRCLHTLLQFYSRVPPVIKTTAHELFSFTLQSAAF